MSLVLLSSTHALLHFSTSDVLMHVWRNRNGKGHTCIHVCVCSCLSTFVYLPFRTHRLWRGVRQVRVDHSGNWCRGAHWHGAENRPWSGRVKQGISFLVLSTVSSPQAKNMLWYVIMHGTWWSTRCKLKSNRYLICYLCKLFLQALLAETSQFTNTFS